MPSVLLDCRIPADRHIYRIAGFMQKACLPECMIPADRHVYRIAGSLQKGISTCTEEHFERMENQKGIIYFRLQDMRWQRG